MHVAPTIDSLSFDLSFAASLEDLANSEPNIGAAYSSAIYGAIGTEVARRLAVTAPARFQLWGSIQLPNDLAALGPSVTIVANIVGSRKHGPGDAALVSAAVLASDGRVISWSPDLDPQEPAEPWTANFVVDETADRWAQAPFSPEVKKAIKAHTKTPPKKVGNVALSGKGGILAVAFSPDGTMVAASDDTGKVRVYDASNGSLVSEAALGNVSVRVLGFTTDGASILSGSKVVSRINTATGKVAGKLAIHKYEASAMALSPTGTRLATAGGGKIVVWDLVEDKQVYTAAVYDGTSIVFADEDHLVVASDTASLGIRRFDLTKKAPRVTMPEIHFASRVSRLDDGFVHIEPRMDGERPAAEQGNERTFVTRDALTLAPGRRFDVAVPVDGFASDDHDRIAVWHRADVAEALVFHASDGRELARVRAKSPTGVGEPAIRAVAFASDGRIAIAAGRGVTIYGPDGALLVAPSTPV